MITATIGLDSYSEFGEWGIAYSFNEIDWIRTLYRSDFQAHRN